MQHSSNGGLTPRRRTAGERAAEAIASSRPGGWFYVNVAPAIDRRLFPLTGGRLTTAGRGRAGLLRVRGAKTGHLRETPLVFARDGDKVILVASRGGDVKHPAWYRNIVANPDVTFTIEGEEREYTAHGAEGPERARAWFIANERYAGYAVYQRRTEGREIPVIVLEPRAPAA
jgi:deazaflavin-dependent oxidoreductase (nitroreductase family)